LQRGFLAVLVVIGPSSAALAQAPLATAFTCQGRLADAGVPADGPFDFFTIPDAVC
jgi:hypothetical protein